VCPGVGAAVEREGLRREPGRKRLAQDATHHPRECAGDEAQLRLADQHRGADVDEAVDVIAVVVGEHDCGDVVKRQAGGRERRGELHLACDLEARERDVAHDRCLATVDEHHASVVLDRPAVDRKRVRPCVRQKQVHLAPRAGGWKEELALDAHMSGRQGVDDHRPRPYPARGLVDLVVGPARRSCYQVPLWQPPPVPVQDRVTMPFLPVTVKVSLVVGEVAVTAYSLGAADEAPLR